MNLMILILAAIVGFPAMPGEEAPNEKTCIMAERIIKPTASWKVLKANIGHKDNVSFLEISAHNPLNKDTPASVDVKFLFIADSDKPKPDNYNLVMAVFYNEKAKVSFRRIYSVHDVVVKNKVKKITTQTPCFEKDVMPIMIDKHLEPQGNVDGGTD